MEKHLLIVGDKFKGFADKNDHVITKSDYFRQTNDEKLSMLGRREILIGQGLTSDEVNKVRASVKGSMSKVLTGLELSPIEELEHKKTVHKHKTENIMISPPHRIGVHSYLSSLQLRDGSAELSDHMTGQHIQGMSLIEGARQLMLSVSEKFLLDNKMKFKSYFVLNNIQSEFKKFVFPVDISMLFKLNKVENKRSGSIAGESECEFTQNGEHVATVRISFSTYDQDFISSKESELASICCDDYFKSFENILEQDYAS